MSLKSWLHRVVPLMLLLIPSLAAAQGIEPDRQRLRTALDDIRTLRTEYAEAFNNKDAAAVSAMYADDGMVIQPDGSMLSGEQIRTAMAEHWLADPARRQRLVERIPLGRIAEVEDVVGSVLYFLAPASAFVTGQILYVDGGLTACQ